MGSVYVIANSEMPRETTIVRERVNVIRTCNDSEEETTVKDPFALFHPE